MRVINEQDVFDIIDDLRDRMTVEGYWSIVERIKALPSATCGNLEKPEIPQHSEDEAADCNLDCISRQAAIDEIEERKNANGYRNVAVISELNRLEGYIMRLPSAQPVDKDIDVPSTDTISRQDAIRIVDGIDTWQAGWRGNAIENIKALPSEQPERKTGRWIEQDDSWDGVYYECSACGEPWTLIDGTPWDNGMNFCPNCGADMRGEGEK